METIFIRASEDIGLGSRHLVWAFVDPDGRTTVFARGRHLKFSLEPPPIGDESPLVLVARVALQAARIENHGVTPRIPDERLSTCLDRLSEPGRRGLRSAFLTRDPDETDEAYLARLQDHGTRPMIKDPVIVRRRGVMGGDPVFRGTRVPPGPIFSTLADMSASEIIRNHCPSVPKADIELALQQACRLLEREAPWAD